MGYLRRHLVGEIRTIGAAGVLQWPFSVSGTELPIEDVRFHGKFSANDRIVLQKKIGRRRSSAYAFPDYWNRSLHPRLEVTNREEEPDQTGNPYE